MYAITGATGNTGKAITEILLSKGKKVRGIGRTADRLQSLVDKGAEAFVGSVTDAAAMTKAFSGVEAVYAVIPPNYAPGIRAYQRAVGEALATAIEKSGVKYVVALSSLGADLPAKNGPVGGLYDFEQRLNKIPAVNIVYLRPTFFMENQLAMIGLIKQMGINGGPLKADLPIPVIATRDIAAAAAEHLLKLDFSGKSIHDLLGPREYTMVEITRILGQAIGKPNLPYVQFSYEDTVKGMVGMGMPLEIAQLMVELNRSANEGLLKPSAPRSAKSTTPTTLEEFAKVFAAVYNQ